MPQKITLSDDDVQRLIRADLDRARAHQDRLRDIRDRCLLLYSMSKEADGIRQLNKPGFSQIVAPTVYESVEGMKVGLDQLFTSPDFFAVKVGQDADAGERLRGLLRWNIFEAQYGARELRAWLDCCLKYQYGVLKIFWDEEFKEQSAEFDELDEGQAEKLLQDGWTFAKFEEVHAGGALASLRNIKATRQLPRFIGPRLKCIDPNAFFFSPDADELDRCRLVAQRIEKRLEDIRKGELDGRYRKGSYARLAQPGGGGEFDDQQRRGLDARYGAIGQSPPEQAEDLPEDLPQALPARKLELWEIYVSLDIDGDGLLEPVIIQLCGEVVLSLEENPYGRPPFRLGRAIENAFTIEGRPFPQSLEQIQLELTQMTRIWNDAAAMNAYGNMITDDPQLAREWETRGVGSVLLADTATLAGEQRYAILQPPPVHAELLKSMELLDARAERISGVTRYNQGLDADSLNKTATGINLISTLAQARQKYTASVIAETYRDAIEDMVECFKLFGGPYLDYFAAKGNEIVLQDYESDFSVDVELGVGPQEKMQQAQVLKEAIMFAAQVGVPSGFQSMEHVAKMYDRMGQLLGVPMEGYHYSVQELEQRDRLKAQMQQMGGQMQQMGQYIQHLQGALQHGQETAATGTGMPGQLPG